MADEREAKLRAEEQRIQAERIRLAVLSVYCVLVTRSLVCRKRMQLLSGNAKMCSKLF